ncbi:MAG: AEC family transporter [Bacteroidetes bacterium]|nr:AEC family transporter [Bacteroidota bacterium]
MVNFILIGVCLAAGMLFRLSKTLPADAYKGINAWIIYIALPAVSFKYLPHISWSKQLLLPIIMPVIVWMGAWVFVQIYAAKRKMPKSTMAALKLSAGLGNTSFVGFPLVMAYFSDKDLSIAVICDQITFLTLSTIGIFTVLRAQGKHDLQIKTVVKKVFLFPPFIGCLAALTIPRFVDIGFIDPLLDKLAITVGPLALFSIGLQLRFSGWRRKLKHITAALSYKLLLAPALLLIVAMITNFRGNASKIAVFEAAMPTQLTSGIVAEEYNTDPGLVNLVIGLGIIIALATTAIWSVVLKLL